MVQAVLLAHQVDGECPRSLFRFCGLTLFERNLRLLVHCGVKHITVVVNAGSELVRAFADSCLSSDIQVELVEINGSDNQEDLKAVCAARDYLDDLFIQLRADFVYDRRVIDTILAGHPNTFLVHAHSPFPSLQPEKNEETLQDQDEAYFYGLSLLNRSFVDRFAEEAADCDPFESREALERMRSKCEIHYLNMDEIPTYLAHLRRSLPVACFTVQNEEDARLGRDILVNATQKGTLDLPARYLHPIPENWITRRLLDTRITPNQVTILSNLIAFSAIGLFWQGSLASGVFFALAVGVLDGVDGKLARLKLLYSKFGDRLDHVLDLIYEPLWYLAIGGSLSRATDYSDLTPLKLSVGIVIFSFLDRVATGLFKYYKKVELFDYAAVDRFFRQLGARRNINVLILLAGVISGQVLGAIRVIFVLTVITAVFHGIRATQLGIRRE